jgi:hypothetical protein
MAWEATIQYISARMTGAHPTGHAEGNVGMYQLGSLPNEGYLPLYHCNTFGEGTPIQGEMAGFQTR